jgi:hypothetical protein
MADARCQRERKEHEPHSTSRIKPARGGKLSWYREHVPTVWDVRAFAVTFLLAALLFAVACAITGATDEGAIAWPLRAMRTLPAVPACGAAALLVVLRRAERRGELLALASLGCSPARAAAFAVAGAAALSVMAAAFVATRAEAPSAFFPRAPSSETAIRVDGDSFVDEARGVRILQTGEMSVTPRESVLAHAAAPGRGAAAAFILLAFGVGLALVAAPPVDSKVAMAVMVTVALAVLLLQAAAAGRISPLWSCAPALLLLMGATVRYREPSW